MSEPFPNYWNSLAQQTKETLQFQGDLFSTLGTADLSAAYWTARDLAWTLWNGPVYLLNRFRTMSRPDSSYDFSFQEALEDLLGFAIDLEGIIETGGIANLGIGLMEVASVRSRPAHIGPHVAGSASDALLILLTDVLNTLSGELGLSWFLGIVRKVVPSDLELDGSLLAVVINEALRANHLESKGRSYEWDPEYTFTRREFPKEETEKWKGCCDIIRGIPNLREHRNRVDLLQIVACLRPRLKGFQISLSIAELDLEFSKAARLRIHDGQSLQGGRADQVKQVDVERDKQWEAIRCLRDHPDWSDTRIAEEIGVHRTTLYTWRDFRAAKAARNGEKNRLARGWKNQGGMMEAWDDDN